MNEFQTAIQQAAGTFNRDIVEIIAATVTAVDIDTRTCTVTPISGDAKTEISGVMLMAEVSDGLFQVPKIDSTVIVGISTKQKSFVIMTSDVETMALIGDELGGIVKVIPLTEKLNNIEQDINDLKTIFSTTWIVVPSDGGAALKAAAATWAGIPLVETQQEEIENIKIKHGE